MGYRIIFATGNEGKMREVRLILADLGMEVLSMKEAGVSCEVEENGRTFGENARIKARAVWEKARERYRDGGSIVLADDSGLVVDYLGGEPGIYSARYLGEDTSYDVKNQVIIDRMEGAKEEERTARFVSAIAAAFFIFGCGAQDAHQLLVWQRHGGRAHSGNTGVCFVLCDSFQRL